MTTTMKTMIRLLVLLFALPVYAGEATFIPVTGADITDDNGNVVITGAVSPTTITLAVSNPNNDLVTGDGQVYWRVPALLNGWSITAVAASVSTVSSGSAPVIQLRNAISSVDILSTRITIDASEKDSKDATAPAVINASNDTVATGDQIAVDVDTAGTGTRGLEVSLTLEAP